MKTLMLSLLLGVSYVANAQYNTIPIPAILTGTNFNLTIHTDSVQFLPGRKTFTNAFNQYAYLGPTLILNKGDLVNLNVTNHVLDTTAIHWHGLHVPAMADGGPHSMVMDGDNWNPQFEVKNNASTFWYHPHTHMKTGQQAMRGAAGFIIVRDTIEAHLNLPRTYGVDDFPLVVQSQQFDSLNQILWRGMNDSILLVNGTTQPQATFPAQVVRLRLLNGSQERNFNFGFTNNRQFYVIGNDGGLLHAPVQVTRIRLSPGERAEILLDLSGMNGQSIELMSYASEFPMGVQGGTPMPGMGSTMYSPLNGVDFNILHIIIGATTVNPVTTIPSSLVNYTPWTTTQANTTRNIRITAQNMMSMDGPFYFNGHLFDMNRIDYRIPLNNIEIWSITNQTMVAHPFHIHDVQFFVVDRDGVIAPPEERGYKDVVMVAPNETVRFITKFEDYADTSMPYMYHCHVLMHEDDGMMGQFIVTPPLGVQNLSVSKESLCVYPNPSTGYFSVAMQSDKQDTGELSLSDMTGKIIFRTFVKLNQGEQLISSPFGMANLPAGVYLVQFTGDQSIRQTKLLIEK